MTRRDSLAMIGVSALASAAEFPSDLVKRHDDAVEYYLKNQVTDPSSRWRGAVPDNYGLHAPGTAVGLWDVLATGFIVPQSRHYKSSLMIERMKLAADFVDRSLSPEANIYLPITNFNSPPDTAFATRTAATTAFNARKANAREVLAIVEPRVRKFATALTTGGIHTPNHRWVVCAALAQVNELWPDSAYIRRIDQWLAEGIDLDEEGQWTERSTGGYNGVSDNAFVVMADKLKRPELLEPVRRNLEAMLYMLHPNGEVETGFSTRQDAYTRATMAGWYWLPIQYFAAKLNDRRFGQIAKDLFPKNASLSTLMAFPELNRLDFAADPIPDDYLKELPHNRVVRIRRGLASVTIHTSGRDRFLSLRHGDAVIEAVRFATAFFGKGQFVPESMQRSGKGWQLVQDLDGPYYQPFTPVRKIGPDDWDATQKQRPRTQVCRIRQSATISELAKGIRIEIAAEGTDNVPIAIEINLREGGKLEGVTDNLFTASEARFSTDTHAVTITGGGCEHKYVDVRGARPRLSGRSIYVTGYTPFRRTLDFTWG